jgi:hypothetical protein
VVAAVTDPATTIREALAPVADASMYFDGEGLQVWASNLERATAEILDALTELEQQLAEPKVFRLEREARLAAERERDQLAATLRDIAAATDAELDRTRDREFRAHEATARAERERDRLQIELDDALDELNEAHAALDQQKQEYREDDLHDRECAR